MHSLHNKYKKKMIYLSNNKCIAKKSVLKKVDIFFFSCLESALSKFTIKNKKNKQLNFTNKNCVCEFCQ
jgi:hypothetical protein